MLAGLDGDIILYQAGFAAEYLKVTVTFPDGTEESYKGKRNAKNAMIDWLENNSTDDSSNELSLDSFITTEERIYNDERSAHIIAGTIVNRIVDELAYIFNEKVNLKIYFTDGRSFREKRATMLPYKGNRDGMIKPYWKDSIRKYLENTYWTQSSSVWEADDLLAMACTQQGACIVSIDKDLLQVPGKHYNINTKEYKVVDQFQGDLSLCRQLLVGDSTDNIPGLPGVGNKTADKMLAGCAEFSDMWDVVCSAYKERWDEGLHGLTPRKALKEVGDLVYICRSPEDSFSRYVKERLEQGLRNYVKASGL